MNGWSRMALVAAFAACCLALASAAQAAEFNRMISNSGKAELTVSTRSGSIEVVGWDRSEVMISCKEVLDSLIEVDGDEVRVGPNPKDAMNPLYDEDIKIRVPFGSSMDVKTVNGTVKVENVHGKIEISAVSGDVRVRGGKDKIDIKVTSGDVLGEDISGPEIEVKTVSGTIDLSGVTAKRVDLKTTSGGIEVEGSFPADGSVHAKTMSGTITVTLPKDAGFDLEARTMSGNIRSEFELDMSGSKIKVKNKIGGGGTKVDISSMSGGLLLRAKDTGKREF